MLYSSILILARFYISALFYYILSMTVTKPGLNEREYVVLLFGNVGR